MYRNPNIKTPTPSEVSPSKNRSRPNQRFLYWCITFSCLAFIKMTQHIPFSFNFGGTAAYAETSNIEEKKDLTKKETKESEESKKSYTSNPIAHISIEKAQILQTLAQKEIALQKREQLIKDKESQVQLLFDQAAKTKKELVTLQKEIEQKEKSIYQKIEEPVKQMAKLYEGMKPDQAARILKTFDSHTLARLIHLMSKQKASGILALLDETKAKEVTMLLIQPNQFNNDEKGKNA